MTTLKGGTHADSWFVKTNASGTVQLDKAHSLSAHDDCIFDLLQTSDGRYTLTGMANNASGARGDFLLFRIDSNGMLLWNKTYGKAANQDHARALVQTADGGYALAGGTESYGAGGCDFWLVKTDTNGTTQWNMTFSGPLNDGAYALLQTEDGGYAVAGYRGNSTTALDFWLIKTDTSGNEQWNKTYGGGGLKDDCAFALVQTSDEGYSLAGYTKSYGSGDSDVWLVKTDVSGNMEWSKTYGGAYRDEARGLIQNPDGSYVIAGFTRSYGSGDPTYDNGWLIKTSDAVPPRVVIISPQLGTYNTNYVPLTFTVNEPTSWIGYSLNDEANVTITGNTTLVLGSSPPEYHVVVYANDTEGNMGQSSIVYFSVDTMAPYISVISPENKTYASADVPLTFSVWDYSGIFWEGYSLDGQANVTIHGNGTLVGLPEGSHTLVIYATDFCGNTRETEATHFAVDITVPSSSILSPQNSTYLSSAIPLNFTLSEPASWMGYSLDNQANVTINGNTTLTGLSQGSHGIIVYANDTAGNMCVSESVYFTIADITPPIVVVFSPLGATYYSSSVSLTFTVVDDFLTGPSWTGYSLDGEANVTVTGNTTLSLADGAHGIIVYANDTSGNMGSSETVHFAVNSSFYDPWKSSFIALDSYPVVDFAVYNGSLYAAADSRLYAYDGISCSLVDAPAFVTSLEPYGGKLVVGGHGGLYSYDGASFSLVFSVPTYIGVLGAYNNTLYAGTMLDNPPKLYYCDGSAENPADWHIETSFSPILNFSGAFGSVDSFAVYNGKMYVASGNTVYRFDGTSWSVALSYEYAYAFLDMQVYDGKLYLATRDLNRIPLYMGGTGFSGT
ncbi:hypothetical protein MUP59_04785, partial [Candidatus Bathyarchaeota archaeon]|nr:hypothetical protein [Candidatus Bathyarchaeota archaeon]